MTAVLPLTIPLAGRPVMAVPERIDLPTLEHRFAAGIEHSLAEAYEAHGSLIYSFCLRKLDPESARDLTQEVFVSAWRSHHRFDPERGPLRAWLMSIAKNKVIDTFRKRARRPHVVTTIDDHQTPAEPSNAEASISRMADRMMLAHAMDDLSDRARKVVELSFYRQMTHQEIAEETGIPLGTVKSDLRRSLLSLRRSLEHGQESADV